MKFKLRNAVNLSLTALSALYLTACSGSYVEDIPQYVHSTPTATPVPTLTPTAAEQQASDIINGINTDEYLGINVLNNEPVKLIEEGAKESIGGYWVFTVGAERNTELATLSVGEQAYSDRIDYPIIAIDGNLDGSSFLRTENDGKKFPTRQAILAFYAAYGMQVGIGLPSDFDSKYPDWLTNLIADHGQLPMLAEAFTFSLGEGDKNPQDMDVLWLKNCTKLDPCFLYGADDISGFTAPIPVYRTESP